MIRRVSPTAALAASCLILLLAFAGAAQAGSPVKARLSSPGAAEEVTGSLTLDGYILSGRLVGGDIDVTVTGVVKSRAVEVEITGRIVPSCSLNRQSMSGVGNNDGANTSLEMSFQCPTKANGYGGGADYLFRLNVSLPPLHPISPGNSDPGEEALNGSLGLGEVQRYLT
jgi:hypothetical protein